MSRGPEVVCKIPVGLLQLGEQLVGDVDVVGDLLHLFAGLAENPLECLEFATQVDPVVSELLPLTPNLIGRVAECSCRSGQRFADTGMKTPLSGERANQF